MRWSLPRPTFRKCLRVLWPKGRWRWPLRALVLSPIFMVGSVELTSQSWFCNSCHIMNPYYSSWQHGTHKDVECVKCHIPPGFNNFAAAKLNGLGQVVDDVLSRTSTKPSANVSDAACTRSGCHNLDRIRASSTRKGRYFFDHGKHLGLDYNGIEIHCTTCHSHVQGNKHFEVNTNACVTCHLHAPKNSRPPTQLVAADAATGQHNGAAVNLAVHVEPGSDPTKPPAPPSQCRTCHDPPDKAIDYHGLKVVHSEYVSYGAQCESCHSGVTDKPLKIKDDQCFACHEFGIEKMTSPAEMHRVHSGGRHKVECFSCHGVTRHGPVAQSMQLDQIECQSCHHGQHSIQQKTYKLATTQETTRPFADLEQNGHQPANVPAVSPMFLAHVSCSGCHVNDRPVSTKPESGATVAAAVSRACDNCHKPGLGDKMIPLWQKNTHTLYDQTAKLLPPSSRTLSPEDAKRVAEAKNLLDLVRLDGSWGVHNPRYTQKVLEEARQKLSELPKDAGTAAGTGERAGGSGPLSSTNGNDGGK